MGTAGYAEGRGEGELWFLGGSVRMGHPGLARVEGLFEWVDGGPMERGGAELDRRGETGKGGAKPRQP